MILWTLVALTLIIAGCLILFLMVRIMLAIIISLSSDSCVSLLGQLNSNSQNRYSVTVHLICLFPIIFPESDLKRQQLEYQWLRR